MNTLAHLEIIVGTMFSGKSTELIRRINRYEIAGNKVQVFKPALDARYSLSHVYSHDGLKKEVHYVKNTDELKKLYDPHLQVLAVDEPQFLESEIVDFCEQHVINGGISIVSLLLKDFQDNYFRFKDGRYDTSEFIRRADHVMYLKALCTFKLEDETCGEEATRVQRLIDGTVAPKDSPLVLVGGKEAYEPRCRQHYQFYKDSQEQPTNQKHIPSP